MKSIIHNPAPNIVPGLNLTAERFQQILAWAQTVAADTIQAGTHSDEYGLVVPFDEQSALLLEKESTKLLLRRCCGITAQGSIINILEGYTPTLQFDLSTVELHPHQTYRVLIEVDHGPRKAFGPESDDLPKRPLYSMPSYELHVQPTDQALARRADAFPIGVLTMENGSWVLADYIPPSMDINADSVLNQCFVKYCEGINVLMENMPKIVRQTDSYQEKSMIELREFTLQLGSYITQHERKYKYLASGGHPYLMLEFWAAFARQTSFLLQCLTDRSGFYNLINENTRSINGVFFTPQSLDKATQELANMNYQHDNILGLIEITNNFLELIVPIFKGLAIGAIRPTGKTGTWRTTPKPEGNNNQSLTW